MPLCNSGLEILVIRPDHFHRLDILEILPLKDAIGLHVYRCCTVDGKLELRMSGRLTCHEKLTQPGPLWYLWRRLLWNRSRGRSIGIGSYSFSRASSPRSKLPCKGPQQGICLNFGYMLVVCWPKVAAPFDVGIAAQWASGETSLSRRQATATLNWHRFWAERPEWRLPPKHGRFTACFLWGGPSTAKGRKRRTRSCKGQSRETSTGRSLGPQGVLSSPKKKADSNSLNFIFCFDRS